MPVLVSTNVSPILCFIYEFAGRVLTLWFVEVEKNEMKRSFAQRVGNFCLLSEDILYSEYQALRSFPTFPKQILIKTPIFILEEALCVFC